MKSILQLKGLINFHNQVKKKYTQGKEWHTHRLPTSALWVVFKFREREVRNIGDVWGWVLLVGAVSCCTTVARTTATFFCWSLLYRSFCCWVIVFETAQQMRQDRNRPSGEIGRGERKKTEWVIEREMSFSGTGNHVKSWNVTVILLEIKETSWMWKNKKE